MQSEEPEGGPWDCSIGFQTRDNQPEDRHERPSAAAERAVDWRADPVSRIRLQARERRHVPPRWHSYHLGGRDVTAALWLVIALALATGYGAQRSDLCIITGIEQLLDRRSPRILLASLRISIWSIVATVAIVWLVPSAHVTTTFAVISTTFLGGLLFGVGAAINRGCAFGTLTRLGAGDFSFALTLVGIAIGLDAGRRVFPAGAGRQLGPTFLASPSPVGIAVLIAATLFCLREVLIRRGRLDAIHWPPEYSAILIGTTGGALYALTGDWSFTLLLRSTAIQAGTTVISLASPLLTSSATLAGAAAAALVTGQFKPRIASGPLPRRLIGGALMGLGGALIPGGNSVLVLEGIPALSPHAIPAYLAVLMGAAVAIIILRRLPRLPSA